MKLIDYYVSEVGRRLPEKMREDIEREIRSMIEDTLEDESHKQGRPVDEEMVVDVLKRLGPPEKMASSYLPPRYLIGPELYPAFIKTLKIVLSIIAVLVLVGAGMALGVSARLPGDVAKLASLVVQQSVDAIFRAAGVIVLIFAIIQWANPRIKKSVEKSWDPRKLRAEPDPETVKPAGMIVGVVFSLFFLVLLNVFPQGVAFTTNFNGQWYFVPVLTPAFLQYLPWISLLIALQASLRIIVAGRGRWESSTRWASIGLSVLGIGLAYSILTGPAIVAIDPTAAARLGWFVDHPNSLANINDALNWSVRLAVGIALAVEVIEIGKNLYRLLIKGKIPNVVGV
jgi:hypothetical protein